MRLVVPDGLWQVIKVISANGLNLVASFGSIFLLTRELDVASYGDYALILSVQAFFLIFANAIGPGVLLCLNRHRDELERAAASGLYLRLGLGCVILLVTYLLGETLAERLHQQADLAPLYLLMGLQSVLFMMERHLLQIFQTTRRFTSYSIASMLSRLGKLLGFLVLAWLGKLDLTTAFLIIVGAQVLPLLTALVRLEPGLYRWGSCDRGLMVGILRISSWILFTEAFLFISNKINIFIISSRNDALLTGYFGFAEMLIYAMLLISQSVNSVVSPRVLQAGRSSLLSISLKVFAGLVPVYGALALALYTTMPLIIEHIFKGKYDQSLPFFNVMVWGACLYMATNAPMSLILRLKRTRWIFVLELVGASSLVLLNLLLWSSMGALGAAWAYTLSRAAYALAMLVALAVIFVRRDRLLAE